jgi:hypothetical protein
MISNQKSSVLIVIIKEFYNLFNLFCISDIISSIQFIESINLNLESRVLINF